MTSVGYITFLPFGYLLEMEACMDSKIPSVMDTKILVCMCSKCSVICTTAKQAAMVRSCVAKRRL